MEYGLTQRAHASRSPLLERSVAGFARHWLAIVTGLVAVYAGLPWLAPVLMKLGWTGPANAIYLVYSFMCHQLPQRSYFLFGSKPTYSLAEVSAVWEWRTLIELRRFIGTPEMGYKVAYAHRLTAIWTSVLISSLLFSRVRHWLRPLPVKWYLLLILPMAVDGFTHLLTEVIPFIDWRATNAWFHPIAEGLGWQLSANFYTGTTIGSLNWALRTVTGALFGTASVWLVFPHTERAMASLRDTLSTRPPAAIAPGTTHARTAARARHRARDRTLTRGPHPRPPGRGNVDRALPAGDPRRGERSGRPPHADEPGDGSRWLRLRV